MRQTLIFGNIITMDEKRPFAKTALVKNGEFAMFGGVTSPRNGKEAITREQSLRAMTIKKSSTRECFR